MQLERNRRHKSTAQTQGEKTRNTGVPQTHAVKDTLHEKTHGKNVKHTLKGENTKQALKNRAPAKMAAQNEGANDPSHTGAEQGMMVLGDLATGLEVYRKREWRWDGSVCVCLCVYTF